MTDKTECNVDKVAIFIEIEGEAYTVALPHEQKLMLINIASSMNETGALPVIALPEGFEFTTLGELQETENDTRMTHEPSKKI